MMGCRAFNARDSSLVTEKRTHRSPVFVSLTCECSAGRLCPQIPEFAPTQPRIAMCKSGLTLTKKAADVAVRRKNSHGFRSGAKATLSACQRTAIGGSKISRRESTYDMAFLRDRWIWQASTEERMINKPPI
jgi:hypothetical protein